MEKSGIEPLAFKGTVELYSALAAGLILAEEKKWAIPNPSLANVAHRKFTGE
ncbi:MAG: hypothetical protein ACHQF3_03010 [Alphaproteobacteria bacterium]